MNGLNNFFSFIYSCIATIRFIDIIDIIVVTLILYAAFKFIRNTRTLQLLKGIVVFFLIMQFAQIFGMNTTSYLLRGTFEFGILAILIVFQPELRKVLEQLGKGGVKKLFNIIDDSNNESNSAQNMIDEIAKAAMHLSGSKTGALIVFERQIKITEIIDSGTPVKAAVVAPLIESIFFHNSPLHDGAVVIRKGEIAGAGCLLPLTAKRDIASDLGTRHRAAIGMSENSDAVALVVSEETGTVSVSVGGNLRRDFDKEDLVNYLSRLLIPDENKISKSIKRRRKDNAKEV